MPRSRIGVSQGGIGIARDLENAFVRRTSCAVCRGRGRVDVTGPRGNCTLVNIVGLGRPSPERPASCMQQQPILGIQIEVRYPFIPISTDISLYYVEAGLQASCMRQSRRPKCC